MSSPSASVDRMGEHAALFERAREQHELGDLRGAEATCSAALRVRPDDAESHRLMGSILLSQNRAGDAIGSLDESLRLRPSDARTHKKLAQALAAQGRREDAVAADRRALELQPGYAGALAHLASLKRFTSHEDDDLAAMEALAADEALADDGRAVLFFALGKAYEELGSYERAFEFVRSANALARGFITWDSAAGVRALERTHEVFSHELLDRLADAGAPSDVPVLIVGMPRSGTTLVEQIVASHPAAHGGGERPDLIEIASVLTVLTEGGLPFPDSMVHVRPEMLPGLAEGYVSRLSDLAPGAARVTDKTPRNFRQLGLLRLLLPNAKVIHCVRDPVDTCFSCYALNMVAQPYTYDLVELGEYYRGYTQLMEHWRDVLPPGWILDVRYEDLVADLEGESRRILAHCDLEWDDACLRFHSTERAVTTASVMQVRQPVYRSSLGRGRRFEPYLGELLAALGPGA
ncbi:MAG: tetratricopeptide repeat-containing sulfotransferase family protein [Gaiellaceae bacterium]